MPAAETAGWSRHFDRYPPIEYIMASIWQLLASFLSNKPAPAMAMGFWLESPAARSRREAKESYARQVETARFIEAAYDAQQATAAATESEEEDSDAS